MSEIKISEDQNTVTVDGKEYEFNPDEKYSCIGIGVDCDLRDICERLRMPFPCINVLSKNPRKKDETGVFKLKIKQP